MKEIKIKAAFMTRFGRLETTFLETTLEPVRALLASAELDRIAHVCVAAYAPGELCGIADPFRAMTQAIQTEFPSLRARYHGVFKTGGNALYYALTSLIDGSATGDILVVGSEKMTHMKPAEAAGWLSQRENPHDRMYGATLPALGALVTNTYLREYSVPERALHQVAVKNHANGDLNPRAHFTAPVTLEQVVASPLIADPLRRLHCAPLSDGAAAVLLSPETARSGDVRYIGWGRGVDTPLFQERDDVSRFVATRAASASALQMSAVSTSDIDIVEIHDAFTSFELINLEEMGFYPIGMSWHALDNGNLCINGRLAVNTSGGMKARGHPIGAAGLSSSLELYEQLRGQAGERQHRGARLGMIQSVGGVSNESFVFVLECRGS